MATSRIYIDINSGTWGDAKGIYLADITDEDQEYLSESPDSDINQFGFDMGEPAISAYEAASWINKHVSPEAREAFLAEFSPES